MSGHEDTPDRSGWLVEVGATAQSIETILAEKRHARPADVEGALLAMLRPRLHRLTPQPQILASGARSAPSARFWVLGLTRSSSAANGGKPVSSSWCATLALIEESDATVGAVVQSADRSRWCAVKDHGAIQNDVPTSQKGQRQSIVPAKVAIAKCPEEEGDWCHAANARHALVQRLGQRSALDGTEGAPPVDLTRLAEHRVGGTVAFSNRPWEVAAGVVIARETGAIVVDQNGHRHSISSEVTIAGVPGLVGEILATLDSLSGNGGGRAAAPGTPSERLPKADAPRAEEPLAPAEPEVLQAPDPPGPPGPPVPPVPLPVPTPPEPEDTSSSDDRRLDLPLRWATGPVVDTATEGAKVAAAMFSLKAFNQVARHISAEDPGSIARPFEVAADLLLYVDDWTCDKAEGLIILTLRLCRVPDGPAKIAASFVVEVLAQPIDNVVQITAFLLRVFGWSLEIMVEQHRRQLAHHADIAAAAHLPQDDWDLVVGLLVGPNLTELFTMRDLLVPLWSNQFADGSPPGHRPRTGRLVHRA